MSRRIPGEIVLHLSKEEFAHIMGSVSQDDAEYCICPDPLKNYLHEVAETNDVRDKNGHPRRIGW
jgi:hypothetical protein